MSKITCEQMNWIDSLICTRLSKDEGNLVINFTNSKIQSLAELIKQSSTFEEDGVGKTAYYLVKNSDENVLFYFSLRCGLMYEPLLNDDDIVLCRAYAGEISLTPDIQQRLDDFQTLMSFSDTQMTDFLAERYHKFREQTKMMKQEKQIHENDSVNMVYRTFPALELSHFCKNDSVSAFEDDSFLSHRLGELVFWFKILPIAEEVMKHVGTEYVYLFAADKTDDELLVNYYRNFLKFERDSNYGTNKPLYDSACKFMCLNLKEAMAYKEYLMSHFNPDVVEDVGK